MDWLPLIELGKVVGGVAVAIATIWKVIPKLWNKLVGLMTHEMQAQITQMSVDISFIVTELKTNGGASLRDSVIRNEDTLGRIEAMTWNNVEIQRARMDNDPEMIFITDKVGNLTWVNRSYSRHTGRTIEELQGSGWINVIHPTIRERVKESWYEAVKYEREYEQSICFMDTAGVEFTVDVRSYKLTSTDGEVTGFMGSGNVVGPCNCKTINHKGK